MSNEKTPLKVEGLGEKTVPEVAGLKKNTVDVTSTPTVTPPAPEQKIDVTSTPTVAPAAPEQKIDVTATPTVAPTTAAPRIDVTTTPTVGTPAAQRVDVTAAPTVGGTSTNNFNPMAMPGSTPSAPSNTTTDMSKYFIIGGAIIGVIVIIAIIIAVTGGKKIVCTQESSSDGLKFTYKTTYKFDDDGKMKSITYDASMDYSNSPVQVSDEQLEAMAKSEMGEYGKDATYSVNNGVITISYTKSGDEDLKYYKEVTYDKMSEEIKKNDGKYNGTTCTVK